MEPSSAIVGFTALILIFFTSLPALISFFYQATSKEKNETSNETSELYQDQDGIATEETQKAYSAALPKYIALSCSLLGWSASTIVAVFTTVHPVSNIYVEHWVGFVTWVGISSKHLVFMD